MIQCCLNGDRDAADVPGLPSTPVMIARAAAEVVGAGAAEVHVHPQRDGRATLDPATVDAVVTAVRAAVPGTPVGLTTGAWASSDRLRDVAGWSVLPDYVSLNWHEDGAADLARLCLDRGIGIEAGLFVWEDGLTALRASGLAGEMLRLLVECREVHTPADAADYAGRVRDLGRPVLAHGYGRSAWPIARWALAHGFDTRIGLEDVLELEDGTPADNAALVRALGQGLGEAEGA